MPAVPRGNPAWPLVGILAQRARARPNRIGVSTCELLGVDGLTVRVRGLDAIDGTPVLDLKPYIVEFAPRGPDAAARVGDGADGRVLVALTQSSTRGA